MRRLELGAAARHLLDMRRQRGAACADRLRRLGDATGFTVELGDGAPRRADYRPDRRGAGAHGLSLRHIGGAVDDKAIGLLGERRQRRRDLRGRVARLRGQRLHFAGDHREAAAGIAGACRFDGGVQGEQIGLIGDGGDLLGDLADVAQGAAQGFDLRAEAGDAFHEPVNAGDRGFHGAARCRHLAAGAGGHVARLLRRGGDAVVAGAGLRRLIAKLLR